MRVERKPLVSSKNSIFYQTLRLSVAPRTLPFMLIFIPVRFVSHSRIGIVQGSEQCVGTPQNNSFVEYVRAAKEATPIQGTPENVKNLAL